MYYVQMIYHVNLNMVAHPPLGTPKPRMLKISATPETTR